MGSGRFSGHSPRSPEVGRKVPGWVKTTDTNLLVCFLDWSVQRKQASNWLLRHCIEVLQTISFVNQEKREKKKEAIPHPFAECILGASVHLELDQISGPQCWLSSNFLIVSKATRAVLLAVWYHHPFNLAKTRLTVKFSQNFGVLYEMYCRSIAITVTCLCVLQQMREDIDELERLRDEYMQKNKEQVGLPPHCPPPPPPSSTPSHSFFL